MKRNVKDVLKLTSAPVIFASLCCLSPVILVLLGISGTVFASTLSDNLYGDYKWVFRGAGLAILALTLLHYFRKKQNICTLDQVKRRKNEIIYTVLVVLVSAILLYIFFLYVVVHYIGVWLNLW